MEKIYLTPPHPLRPVSKADTILSFSFIQLLWPRLLWIFLTLCASPDSLCGCDVHSSSCFPVFPDVWLAGLPTLCPLACRKSTSSFRPYGTHEAHVQPFIHPPTHCRQQTPQAASPRRACMKSG
ncbi:unnamed protein product [Protopolystoma xenopodis]|uniref:Uncharacterized protein n=1 Tax=Protopolystoma xenopodis TaxID=117903 RepID=A0A3S5B7H7_9PLAT|nr:unnamed protein product [Protopolystoma xenopodis]